MKACGQQKRISATRFLKKMRGGAQSHLVEASDGNFYIVKFQDNPQHRRVLINESIASALVQRLGIRAPRTAAIQVTSDFLAENPEIDIRVRNARIAVTPGLHFGSRHPGNPAELAVYDFLPSSLLRGVNNYCQFLGMLVFDKWIGNTDKRQAIFYRSQSVHDFANQGIVAEFIDNGYAFGGTDWQLRSVGPLTGLYYDRTVYADVRSLEFFESWIGMVERIPEEEIWRLTTTIPEGWLADDRDRLPRLIETLLRRRTRLHDLIFELWRAKPEVFPNWDEHEADRRLVPEVGARRYTDRDHWLPSCVGQL